MKKERTFQNVPVRWFIILPLFGVIHKVLEWTGWLKQGSWLNFLLLIGILSIWGSAVLKETTFPFAPLVWIGSLYGSAAAILHLLYWLNFREPLGLGKTGWSFDELLEAVNYYLKPGLQFLGDFIFGVLLGVLTGLTARLVLKVRRKRN